MKHHNNPPRLLSSVAASLTGIGLTALLSVMPTANVAAAPFTAGPFIAGPFAAGPFTAGPFAARAIAPRTVVLRAEVDRFAARLNVMDLRFLPAMRAAGSVVGQPYRFGGAAPGGFDCSGLVQWSFAQAGVSLPRDSRSQRAATLVVGEEQLRPGDLVFYGAPVSHVGIAIGSGQMIDAPRPGRNVQVVDIHRPGMSPSGFGRIK